MLTIHDDTFIRARLHGRVPQRRAKAQKRWTWWPGPPVADNDPNRL